MSNTYSLKGTKFGIDRDYPKNIIDKGKELYQSQDARDAREKGIKTQIRHPARLYIQGKLVKDCFPERFTVLKESRIDGFEFEKCSMDQQLHNATVYSKATKIDM